jgi:2,5-diketo-D-gluconate reductase A
VNGYSPFGVTDRHSFAAPCADTVLADPVVVAIAASHRATPAAVILAWHAALGIVVNPRSQNAAHMAENLGVGAAAPWWTVSLTPAEVAKLSSRPQCGYA